MGGHDAQAAGSVRVCATVPELGSLARTVGGEQVSVTVFAKGKEDPHFVDPKPSFIRALNQADLYIQLGMTMELGWAPVLLRNARNSRILPGAPGFVDASTVIEPLEVPTGPVDRAMGDVNPEGNPHYLLDPLNGLKVAGLIRDRLAALRPAQKAYFDTRYDNFASELAAALVGEELAKRYSIDDVQKLALLYEHGKLLEFLKSQGQEELLGGWLGLMAPYQGFTVVDDHNIWPYFARRFGIRVLGHMEPIPGITPTTRHLKKLMKQMSVQDIKTVVSAPYYDPRHAHFVAHETGATVVGLAHQAGSRKGTDDYLAMIDYNVRQLAARASHADHHR
jgi:ABC-type Zn uptake system ZnuABC Zn-binding protein ZnuA